MSATAATAHIVRRPRRLLSGIDESKPLTTRTPSKPTREEIWTASAANLAAFHTSHGRFPRSTEQPLYGWQINQRRTTDPARAAALDAAVPGWRGAPVIDHEVVWKSVLARVVTFVDDNGRLPSPSNDDPDERTLGQWINTQRKKASPDREAVLDEQLPIWRAFANQRRWGESMDALVGFVQSSGDFPHQTSKDPETRRLAHWLKEQRMEAPGDKATALDERVPGWRGRHPGHRGWDESFAGLRLFIAAKRRLPRKLKGPDGEEKRLGAWLLDQRNRASDAQRARLDALWNGWQEPSYSWDEQLAAVKAFHAVNARLPRTNDTGTDRVLAHWLRSQRQAATPAARALLDETFPGWHTTLDSQWNTTLTALAGFCTESRRLPRPKSSDAAEAGLGRWLQKQRVHADGERAQLLDAAVPGWRGRKRAV